MTLAALHRLTTAALCALGAILSGCGGSPSPSTNVVDTTAITVQPSTLVIYPGVPATLLITGGTGSYVVASNNQAIVPIVTAGVSHQLTVIANPVNSDTTVSLSIRDTSTTTPTTATLTVRPGTIANAVTIVPVTTECNVPAAGSTPAVLFTCSGDEALVTGTISQGGNLLPARSARFDVVSGDVRFIVTPPGTTPEVLATTTTVISDQNGLVRVRLRVLPGAPAQNALVQITDPETLAFQRFVVPILQRPGPGGVAFFAVPDSITFTGPFIGRCADNNAATQFAVFGGSPPYNVTSANGFVAVSPQIVTQSGGTFRAQLGSSACFTNAPITITDASGRTVVVTISNVEGTQPAPAAAITLAPTALTLGCGQTASLVVSGGTAPFSAGSSNPLIVAAPPVGRTVGVTRTGAAPAVGTGTTTATISVTDGATVGTATVTSPATCS